MYFNQCLIQNILLHYSKFHFIFTGTADKMLYVNPDDPGLPDIMQDDGPGTDPVLIQTVRQMSETCLWLTEIMVS